MVEHLSGYQRRDDEIVDYQMYELAGTGLSFRGPAPVLSELRPDKYMVCLGAAQTFGCFCDRPFPRLLQQQLGLPVLNLGYGGAGPAFFLKHAALWRYIDDARLVIVQVMSGRSVSNSRFESGGLEYLTRRSDGAQIGSQAAYESILRGTRRWQAWPIPPWARHALRPLDHMISRVQMTRLVRETRRNWEADYTALLARIRKPTLLFWFSRRQPDYEMDYGNVLGVFGDFPQLVNGRMIGRIKPHATQYVECTTSRGSPQPLISRFTGQPVKVDPALDRPDLGGHIMAENNYYPSPQMHEDAAGLLLPHCRQFMS